MLYDKIVLTVSRPRLLVRYLESLTLPSLSAIEWESAASGSNEPETTTNRALKPIDVHFVVRAALARRRKVDT